MHVIFWLGLLAALASGEFAPREGVERPCLQAALSITLAVGLCLWIMWTCRRMCRHLRRLDVQDSNPSVSYRRRRTVFNSLWLTATGVQLGLLQWPHIVHDNVGNGHVLLVDEFAVMLPVALPLGIWWWGQCQIAKAVSARLGPGASPDRCCGPWHELRATGLPMVMPVLIVVSVRDACAVSGVAERAPWFECFAVAAALAATAIGYPLWIRYACGTSPLGRQPLRRHLVQAGRHYRIADYLIWSAPRIPLAAVTGIVPGLRYVLLSHRLVGRWSDEEVEAIVAHELGHVHHGHVLLRLGVVAAPLVVFAGPWSAAHLAGGSLATRSVAMLPVVLAACGIVVIGVVRPYWRLLEHQADGFALWRGSDAEDLGVRPDCRRLSVYLQALEKLGHSTGTRRSWSGLFHPDLAQRRTFLFRTASYPRRYRRFTRRMRLLNGLLAATLLAAVASAVFAA